jgi:hypothetical protein
MPSGKKIAPSAERNEFLQGSETSRNLLRYGSNIPSIEQRIDDLEAEWDGDRSLMLIASLLSLAGISLGLAVHSYWMIVPIISSLLVLQQSFQGWCLATPLLRKMKIRSRQEIEIEKHALKALRGDYVDHESDPLTALEGASKLH